jgi:hypothetical protein
MPPLDILWNTFGPVGAASFVAWAAAALLLVVGTFSGRRFHAWLAAAGAAAVALALASATSASIRSIEIDRSAEVQAAEEAGRKDAREKLRSRAAGIRFAEDTAADQTDVAGVSVAEEQGAYERAVEEQMGKIPAYQRRGKRQRAKPAAAAEDAAAADTPAQAAGETGGGQPASDAGAEQSRSVRMLPEADLLVADHYDRINRGVAWSVLSLAVGLVGCEYLRRFNSTFHAVWPLPLAGTWVDGAFAKEYVVDEAPPSGAAHGMLPDFLNRSVRKGESFILFAEHDPLPGRDALPRFAVGPLHWDLPKRTFRAVEVQADPKLAEIVFESAWFGRGAFVVAGDGPAADAVLADMAAILVRRHGCRAAARRTVNLVWALPQRPAAKTADELGFLCPQMNLRLAVLPLDSEGPTSHQP